MGQTRAQRINAGYAKIWENVERQDILVSFRELTHLAATLNHRQHAGLPITPIMWATLYDATNRAKAVIAEAEHEADNAQ